MRYDKKEFVAIKKEKMMNHPLVFIHGSGDSAGAWRLQRDDLSKDYAVYAIDLPGHGARPDTFSDMVSVQEYAQAAYAIVRDELQLDRPIIGGHSLGGAVTLTMALAYAKDLSGLILVGTGARLRVLPSILEATLAHPEEASRDLSTLAIAEANRESVMPGILRDQGEPGPNMLHRDLAACDKFDCMAHLSEIHLPALIICGAEDRLTPVKYSRYLHDHLPGSTLHIIPNAGHYVMREQPAAVNQAIREWLRTVVS
jgi:pimeloyl-ACP methyl ester carboxylesterase